MEEQRWNINRGFKKLEVWNDAIKLYVQTWDVFRNFPYDLKRVSSNSIDACHSISRNIAEGYCRRSKKEYLNFLNIALGSSGEFYSSIYSCYKANQISKDQFKMLDKMHYSVENKLIKLIESIQRKSDWNDNFLTK